MTETKVDLRYEATRDSFLLWFILAVTAGEKDFDSIVRPDIGRADVKLVVNGHALDAKPTIDRLGLEFNRQVEQNAEERARAMVDDTLEKLRTALRDRLQIEIDEDGQ